MTIVSADVQISEQWVTKQVHFADFELRGVSSKVQIRVL
jgi:hypothetical protein